MPGPHLGGSTVARRKNLGKGFASLLLQPCPSSPFDQGLSPGLNPVFLGRAAFLALLPPCMGPSFSNLFSAPKLISEAASGSASKTKLWLTPAEKHRSQRHAYPQGRLETTQPHPSLPAPPPPSILSCQHTTSIHLGPSQSGSWVTELQTSEPSQAHIHSEMPHLHKPRRK